MIRGSWNKGKKRTPEQLEKLRNAQIKRFENPEERKKLSDAQSKRYENPQERMKHGLPGERNPNFGKHLSDEHKKIISSVMTGRVKSVEERAKISLGNTGKPKSEEHKRKIGLAHLGMKKSHEQIEKMRKTSTGKHHTEETKQLLSDIFSGPNNPAWVGGRKNYCEKWTQEFRRRIRAFFGNKCVECGEPQTDKLLHCHHVYYDKKACCEESPDGKYYSDLGVKGAPKTFEIAGDPNKFVPLCQKCHAKTTPKKDRVVWARKYERLVNEKYGGKSYHTKEEFTLLSGTPQTPREAGECR